MPAYSHRFSPKKFTQHQLFACLVLKEFFRLDYRGVEALLAESDSLRAAIELETVPDFTTLHKACSRLLRMGTCNRLLDETICLARCTPLLRSPVALAAIDSSGFEAHRASNYFVRRRAPFGKLTGKWQSITYRRFPKLGVVCDCHSHLILAAAPHRGPSPDFGHWFGTVAHARRRIRIKTLLADAGYDAEWIHLAAREEFGTRTIIPPKHGRPRGTALPGGYYRRRMARRFDHDKYAQRAQVETTFSMVKRRLDGSVNAYGHWSQYRSLMLKVLTHNIMILKRRAGFRQSRSGHLCSVFFMLGVLCRGISTARTPRRGSSSRRHSGRPGDISQDVEHALTSGIRAEVHVRDLARRLAAKRLEATARSSAGSTGLGRCI